MRKLALLLIAVIASGILIARIGRPSSRSAQPTTPPPPPPIETGHVPALAPARPEAVATVNSKDGTVLVAIAAGKFLMGAADGLAEEQPVHEVELSAYEIAKLDVTNRQFAAFVAATGYETTAEKLGKGAVLDDETLRLKWRKGACWRDPEATGKAPSEDHPVVQVTWDDAQAYARWAGLRLPTEAEWERAARWDANAGRALKYPWGDEAPSGLVGNLPDLAAHERWSCADCFKVNDGFVTTSPVGAFPGGASPEGLLDAVGNVWVWCEDAYDPGFYATSPAKDPCRRAEKADLRVARGGSFAPPVAFCRASCRGRLHPDTPSETQGMRLARSVSGGGS